MQTQLQLGRYIHACINETDCLANLQDLIPTLQQTLAPLHVITTIATGYHAPGSAPIYIFSSIFNWDLKPPA